MHVDLSAAGTMPSSEKHATLATLVLNILSATDQVRDAAKAEADADTEGPGVGGVASDEAGGGHGASATGRAVNRGGRAVQVGNGGSIAELLSARGLLRRHAGVLLLLLLLGVVLALVVTRLSVGVIGLDRILLRLRAGGAGVIGIHRSGGLRSMVGRVLTHGDCWNSNFVSV